jgi:hypothetical protein
MIPFCGSRQIIFENYHCSIHKIKIPLSQASAPYHPNSFTLILPLSEGRVDEAWEPSNKIMFFLPPE